MYSLSTSPLPAKAANVKVRKASCEESIVSAYTAINELIYLSNRSHPLVVTGVLHGTHFVL